MEGEYAAMYCLDVDSPESSFLVELFFLLLELYLDEDFLELPPEELPPDAAWAIALSHSAWALASAAWAIASWA